MFFSKIFRMLAHTVIDTGSLGKKQLRFCHIFTCEFLLTSKKRDSESRKEIGSKKISNYSSSHLEVFY